jgi:hypothetical protein
MGGVAAVVVQVADIGEFGVKVFVIGLGEQRRRITDRDVRLTHSNDVGELT